MKRICVIGPSLKMGGMERASVNFTECLFRAGAKVSYISFFNQERFFKLQPEVVIYEPNGFNIQKLNFFKTIWWLRDTVKSIDPEVVVVFNKLYAALTLVALTGRRQKVVLSERSSPLYRWPKSQDLLMRFIFTFWKPCGIIAQTKIAKEYQQRYYGKTIPIEVIPNILRPVSLYPNIVRENIILAIGRLNDPLKGLDRLIEAFAKIKSSTWELQIAGGSLGDDLELSDLVATQDANTHIRFLGKVQDIDSLMARAAIYVIPSRSEGFPNALCEAMAAGLPCIAFDFVAGPRDIIQPDETGIIVPDGDIQGLTNAIRTLMEKPNERKRLGKKAMSVRERYLQERISMDILNFIQKI